jgi:hypothetical protein
VIGGKCLALTDGTIPRGAAGWIVAAKKGEAFPSVIYRRYEAWLAAVMSSASAALLENASPLLDETTGGNVL